MGYRSGKLDAWVFSLSFNPQNHKYTSGFPISLKVYICMHVYLHMSIEKYYVNLKLFWSLGM